MLASTAAMAAKTQLTTSSENPALAAEKGGPGADVNDVDNATIVYPAVFFAAYSPVSAERWGVFNEFSTRLTYFDLPDAIVSGELNVFDSSITNPFLGTEQRINRRGEASLEFLQDSTGYALNYGMEYNYPFHGGEYNIDITTVTRNDQQSSLNLFFSKVFFDDVTVRLESDNTLDQSRCRERRRYDGTTIDGSISEI